MKIKENVPLAPMTTLRIGGPAKFFAECGTGAEVAEALSFAHDKNLTVFILGGGSNILVSDEGFPGLVIKILIRGREILENDVDSVRIKIGAGEVLDEVIGWAVENNWWGLENLSFIPGLSAGLAIQNAGAYGAEASQVIESVEVFDRKDGKIKNLLNSDCHFRYRQSIFNSEEKGRYIILSLVIKLQKFGEPNISYVDIKKYFAKNGISSPSLSQIRKAIIEIRTKKGQDPNEYWTAGSFFKNLFLTSAHLDSFERKVEQEFGKEKKEEFLEIVQKLKNPDETKTKIPVAWVLDKLLNLKGMQIGGAKLSELQVINIVNIGSATARDVIELFEKVRFLVREKLGVELVNEPEFVGFD